MTATMASVTQRTELVGQNRVELLLFGIGAHQRFGINVFKVREVLHCPPLRRVHGAHPLVAGVCNLRGTTVPVIDLAAALSREPLAGRDDTFLVLTEFSRSLQALLVSRVDRILNRRWEDIEPPTHGGDEHLITALTRIDDELIEVVDVEKIMQLINGEAAGVSEELAGAGRELATAGRVRRVLVADDSSVARGQIQRALAQIGVESVLVQDGRQALERLQHWAARGELASEISMVISDIEMPVMDGYTLTAEIRRDPDLAGLYVLLHSSLSGDFNYAMADRVGADGLLGKFRADEFAGEVLHFLAGSDRQVLSA